MAGMTAAVIDPVEINEAFAAIPLKLMRDMGWTEEETNVTGGASAMGHLLVLRGRRSLAL